MTFLASQAGGPPYRGVPTAPGSFFPKKEKKKKKCTLRGADVITDHGAEHVAYQYTACKIRL